MRFTLMFTSTVLFYCLLLVGLTTFKISAAFLVDPTGLKSPTKCLQLATHHSIETTELSIASTMMESHPVVRWKVRPATPEDEDAVKELLSASYSTLLKDDYDDKVLEDALPLITNPRPDLLACGTWYLVESPSSLLNDATLVGCGGWTHESPGTKNQNGYSHLRHFATHPDYLRKGVARAIWNQIRYDVSGTNSTPTLEVYSTLTAQPFYESLGFRPIEPIYIPIPLTANCKFPSVIMRREAA